MSEQKNTKDNSKAELKLGKPLKFSSNEQEASSDKTEIFAQIDKYIAANDLTSSEQLNLKSAAIRQYIFEGYLDIAEARVISDNARENLECKAVRTTISSRSTFTEALKLSSEQRDALKLEQKPSPAALLSKSLSQDILNEHKLKFAKVRTRLSATPEGDINDRDFVKNIIKYMHETDQMARDFDFTNPTLNLFETHALMTEVDTANTHRLKSILALYTWPTISEFGEETSHSTWNLVQHATHDYEFMEKCLATLERLLPTGEVSAHNYAYLYDRVALHSERLGKKQKYGTQFSVKDGQFELLEYEGTLEELNLRRKEWGLTELEEQMAMLKSKFSNK